MVRCYDCGRKVPDDELIRNDILVGGRYFQLGVRVGSPRRVPSADQPKLADFIVTMLREAGRPLTVRQLAEEAKRRGFVSASSNFPKMVEARTYDLKRKSITSPKTSNDHAQLPRLVSR
jgi:hypothetical protein